jgi:hypothetical protein
MTSVLSKVLDTASQLNAVAGYHIVPPDAKQVPEKIKQGYRFLAYSADFLLLGNACRSDLAEIRRYTVTSKSS